MQSKQIKKLISVTTLIVFLIAQSTSFGNVVLCLGSDGHASFEFAAAGQCSELSHEHASEDNNENDHNNSHCEISENHCGDCEDFKLSLDTLPFSPIKFVKLEKLSSPPSFIPNHLANTAAKPAPQTRFNPLNTYPTILRSIMLRI